MLSPHIRIRIYVVIAIAILAISLPFIFYTTGTAPEFPANIYVYKRNLYLLYGAMFVAALLVSRAVTWSIWRRDLEIYFGIEAHWFRGHYAHWRRAHQLDVTRKLQEEAELGLNVGPMQKAARRFGFNTFLG